LSPERSDGCAVSTLNVELFFSPADGQHKLPERQRDCTEAKRKVLAQILEYAQLALVAMNLYSDGKRHILLPVVVGGVIGSQRDLTIRVSVVDSAGRQIHATPMVVDDETQTADQQTAEDFFRSRWARFSQADRLACLKALDVLGRASIPGLRIDYLRNGRPVVVLESGNWGKVKALRAMHVRPSLRDNFDGNGRLKEDGRFVKLWKQFEKSLLEVKGAVMFNSHVRIPAIELERDGCVGLVKAIRRFADALRAK
jgi:hypothetical protein